MNRIANKSEFALVMAALLDDTNLFNRREWAEFLGVSEPAISQWVGDKTLPRPDILSMILDILRQSTDVPAGPLESFEVMAHKRATEVSPFGKRMLPNVYQYMMRPAFSSLSSTLAKLTRDEQEDLLENTFPEGSGVTSLGHSKSRRPALFLSYQPGRISKRPFGRLKAERLVFPCARATSFMSCVEHEQSSWKHMVKPLFRIMMETGAVKEEQSLAEWNQLSTHPHLMLLGAPGVGKTTFCRYLTETYSSNEKSHTERIGLSKYLHLACLAKLKTENDLETVWRNLLSSSESGTLLLLLDGFDEVEVESRDGVIKALFRFRAQNPAVRFVITSRPSPDLQAFAEIPWFRIEPLPAPRLLAWIRQELSQQFTLDDRWHESIVFYLSSLLERPDVFREIQSPLLLSHSAQLFVRHSLTAHNDVDLFQACLWLLLDDWDEKKNIVRSSNAWARPRHLFQWLSGLCYRSLIEERPEFSLDDVEGWVKKYNIEAPTHEILRLLSESTGIVQSYPNGRWGIVHATLQEYLAAKYIVESSSDATKLLKECLHTPRMVNVLRFACAATNDASRLLNFILTADWPQEVNRIEALADVMAQQFNAENKLIRRSCVTIAEWLDNSFAGWERIKIDADEQISFSIWKLAARKRSRDKALDAPLGRTLVRILHAVHRARLSPAKPELSDRLQASENEVVRAVGESLEVEGYFQAHMLPQQGNDVLVAQVLQA